MLIEFFPEKNIILQIGSIKLFFYGAMYSLSAIGGIFISYFFAKKQNLPLSFDLISNSIVFTMIGGVLGGRIFEILVYNFEYYWSNPLQMFAVWNGGMSIHGGLIGGAIVFVYFWKQQLKTNPLLKNLTLGEISGIFMPALALGLFWGRFGNFMNNELYGRITDVPWAINFHLKGEENTFRHPAQFYAMAKDFTIFCLCSYLLLSSHPKTPEKKKPAKNRNTFGKNGEVFLILLLSYALLRFIVEFFKEVDSVTGLFFGWMTIGQIFSLCIIILVLFLWKKKEHYLGGKK